MDIPETTLKDCYAVQISRKSANVIDVRISMDTLTVSAADGAVVTTYAGKHSCLLNTAIMLLGDIDIFTVIDAIKAKKHVDAFITTVHAEDLDAALKPLREVLRTAMIETIPEGYLTEAGDVQEQIGAKVEDILAEMRLQVRGEEARLAVLAGG